ncbi:MAG: FAD-dependent oxidoreductase, partial [Propionibacteriaceae bacterium]|nr:FAD-dependent oxidoreductase [Propionibacteriaceae bacterium]
LRSRLGPDAELHVFEKEPEVGGRAHHTTFAGERVELGGTLIHTENRRLVELADAVGVPLVPRKADVPGGDDTLLLWDGSKALLRAKLSGIGLPLALIRRYGPFNMLKLQRLARAAKSSWNSVYPLQDDGRVFETAGELIEAAGLATFVGASLNELATRRGISRRLLDEFVTGVLRDMYNQSSEIIALAGLVGLAGAGLAGGSLVTVADGNSTLFAKALDAAGAKVWLEAPATRVESTSEGVLLHAGGGQPRRFDAVILAAPLELANVSISGGDLEPVADIGRRFQPVYTTLVAGEVNPEFFASAKAPSEVITIDDPATVFKALGQTGYSHSLGTPIWKFFSAEALTEAFLAEVFLKVHEVHRHLWQAYPVLTPEPRFRPFKLAGGVYQVNDFESAVSTLETEGALGWSVADLVARDLEAD